MMGTRDTLFLAITRVANAFGVSLWGFLGASAGCTFLFSFLATLVFRPGFVGLGLSFGISGGLYLALVLTMARLSAWEPKWFSIMGGWAQTRLPVLFSGPSLHFGGTTLCPGPVKIKTYEDVRDYVG